MSLTQKIAWNSIVQFISKLATVIFGTLTIALMTRYLGQEGFGQYSTITAYLAFFGILVDFGLQITTVNLMSNVKYDEGKIFTNAFTLRTISAAILFVIAPVIILFMPYDAVIHTGTFILALNYAALAIHQLLIGLFQKRLRMDKIAIAEITGKVLLFGGVWFAVSSDWGLLGILWMIVASTIIQVIIGLYYSQKFISLRFEFDWTIWKKIISDSWPIAISIAFNLVYFKADTLVLSLVRTQEEVGIYSAPYRILEILTAYPYLFVGLVFPILANAWSTGNKEKYKEYFQKAFDFLVIAAVPMVVGTLPLAEKIMTFIAGEDFAASGIVLQIIIFATAIIFVNVIFGYSIVILGKQKKLIGGYIATAAIALTLYLIFIPIYSYIAAAVITIFAELLIFTINVIVSLRTAQFIPRLGIIIKSILASLVMLVPIYIFSYLHIVWILLIAIFTYFVILYLIGGIRKETLLEIMKVKT